VRDVIQKVIATEAEAKRIVEAAKAVADSISSDAQKQAQELVARARQEARAEADGIVTVAVREAGQEKHERLARAIAEIESQVRLDETTRQRAVAGAIRCVCGQGWPT
jgi:vacuolar-type H+-ATPase subunit H